MDSITENFPYFAVYAGCASLLVAVLLVLTKQWHGKLTMDSSVGVQKVHLEPTPRVGGVAIVAGVLVGYVGAPPEAQELMLPLLLAGIPAFSFGLLEDITKTVSVRTRLLATMACGVLGWAITGASLTQVGIPGIDWLLSLTLVSVLFTAFAVGGVANAINIIDGFNGLAAGTAVIILAAFATIASSLGDSGLALTSLFLAAAVIGFTLVNWPLGKMFLGDGGAYFVGFAIAWIAVLLVTRHPSLSPWAPLLVCGYPVLEVMFSIVRRRSRNMSPGAPDRMHLHSLVKRRLTRRLLPNRSRLLRNSATGAIMWIAAAIPAAIAVQWQSDSTGLFLGLAACAAVYSACYSRLARFHWHPFSLRSINENSVARLRSAGTMHAEDDDKAAPVKISVITATWNCASTVTQALDSLDAQTHQNIERVWIDGMSTDGTTELLRERLVQGQATLISEPDTGIYDALNKGIRHATGDVVGFLHADDMLADAGVLEQIAAAFANPAVDAVYGNLQYVKRDSPDVVVRHWRAGAFSPRKLRRGWMPPHPTLYLRRELLSRVGPFDADLRIAADYDHILRIFGGKKKPRVVYLDGVLVQMRAGGASNKSLRNIAMKSLEDLKVLRRNRVGGVGSLAWKNFGKISQIRMRGILPTPTFLMTRLAHWASHSLLPAKKQPESDA